MAAGAVLRFGPAQREAEGTPRARLASVFVGFWLLGLINNAAYVIMIAGANEVAASAVGLVYFCAIGPTILVKLSAPYWFHAVSYAARFTAAAALMAASFCVVALSRSTGVQLVGVALVAVQGGLGEASALALCALHPSRVSLTAWSSGTGFAGILGYFWVAALHHWLGLSFTATLLAALVLPALWLGVFHALMRHSPPGSSGGGDGRAGGATAAAATVYSPLPSVADGSDVLVAFMSTGGAGSAGGSSSSPTVELSSCSSTPSPDVSEHEQQHVQAAAGDKHAVQWQPPPQQQVPGLQQGALPMRQQPDHQQHAQQQLGSPQEQHQRLLSAAPSSHQHLAQQPLPSPGCHAGTLSRSPQQPNHARPPDGAAGHSMTGLQRFKATCRLWPYMVPLFVVYFAEYAMQSGTWTAIGFPVTSPEARHSFYLYSNWLYQAGVFLSRSSGMLFQANRVVLWALPGLQCLLLALFSADAALHVWWGWGLLAPCFAAGLLGGAVYVNSFTLLAKEVEPGLQEFSLAAACVADSVGIAAADLTAILIQGCLFRIQGLAGAAYACGGTGGTGR